MACAAPAPTLRLKKTDATLRTARCSILEAPKVLSLCHDNKLGWRLKPAPGEMRVSWRDDCECASVSRVARRILNDHWDLLGRSSRRIVGRVILRKNGRCKIGRKSSHSGDCASRRVESIRLECAPGVEQVDLIYGRRAARTVCRSFHQWAATQPTIDSTQRRRHRRRHNNDTNSNNSSW